MKILVTGAAGFIGSATCKALSRSGHKVVAIDSFSDYYSVELKKLRANFLLKEDGVDVKHIDISDLNSIKGLIRAELPDCVIHLAAQAGVRIPVQSFDRYTQSNLSGFTNIIQGTIEAEIPNLLYASSSSVYGNQSAIPYSESEKNLFPTSFYGATKLSNEILARAATSGTTTKSRGMRFFTVYGPWGRPDMMYFRILANHLVNHPLDLFGDGSVKRDFTYIDDVTRAIDLLTQELNLRENGFSDVVNVGGGSPVSISDLMEISENLSGAQTSFTQLAENKSDVIQTMASTLYLENLIDWKPSTSLELGMSNTFQWANSSDIKLRLSDWIAS